MDPIEMLKNKSNEKRDLEYYKNLNVFNKFQIGEIERGLLNGSDVSVYARPEFDVFQMSEIAEGLGAGLNTKIFANPEFNYKQMREIKLGLLDNLNVNTYAKQEFNSDQMKAIRTGLVLGLGDVMCTDPRFTSNQMYVILDILIKNIKLVRKMCSEYNYEQWSLVLKDFEDGIDIGVYIRQTISLEEMEKLSKRARIKKSKLV